MTGDAMLDLWATNAFQSVLKPLAAELERASGARLAIAYRSSNRILSEVASGGRADALIATRSALDELAAGGVVERATITGLASAGLGLGVKAGAPVPDLRSPDAVRAALLGARSIVYSSTGASAAYFLRMVEALGIAREVQQKAIVYDGGLVGELVASGEAELGAQMVSEIVAVPGVVLAGALPEAFRHPTLFAAALFAGTPRADAARAAIAVLASSVARPVYERAGMTPAS